jgi:hypothetical protein
MVEYREVYAVLAPKDVVKVYKKNLRQAVVSGGDQAERM